MASMTHINPEEAARILNELAPSTNGRKWTANNVRYLLRRNAFSPKIGGAEFNVAWSYFIVREWLIINIAQTAVALKQAEDMLCIERGRR